MTNCELLKKFYTAFSNGNSLEMVECYHEDIVFKDPVFGELKGEKAINMWKMLLSNRNETTEIFFKSVKANQEEGSAIWIAKYLYGENKRKVTNIVDASFKFKDGKIIEHIDSFSVWTWSRQALGFTGFLLGWSDFMKNKIQKTTNKKLEDFMSKSN
ncbi:nuclear transport factor 2 family protein [Polaribacter sargassicola]|uniref:nuclear transport factor 2 family protein n=1 Tax=Polaribacter sargassicola TaxID=2836891 RepID=UPI001F453C7D|nr:nuclear transport factor 2 family protein [Polaribacter sp. DS7-9]MCG1036638.1 nuclear transport factor 2 family protein [Polaribacter sp. DS7-9]